MRYCIYTIVLGVLFGLGFSVSAQLMPNLGGQRVGISALTFLKTEVSPRMMAMGGSQIALPGDAYAMQWNPGAITALKGPTFSISNGLLTSGLQHSFAGVILPNKKDGAWSMSATSLTGGEMKRRTEFQPEGTGETFYAGYVSTGVGYGQKLTEMFSCGVNLKYVGEYFDLYQSHTLVADLGFLYQTDFRDLKFAVTLANFGGNSRLQGDITPSVFSNKATALDKYSVPAIFRMGFSLRPLKTIPGFLFHAQVDHPGDNAANLRFGMEYNHKDLLFLRTGYRVNVKDQALPTAGIGLRTRVGKYPFTIEYATDPHQRLGWYHRLGLSLTLFAETR